MSGAIRVLRLSPALTETSSEYYAFSLPMLPGIQTTYLSYFPPKIQKISPEITVYDGNGQLLHFLKKLYSLLSRNSYDVIHAHSPHMSLFVSLMLLLGFWSYRKKSLLTIHNVYSDYRLSHRLMFLVGFIFFRRIVYCSSSAQQSFPRLYRKIGSEEQIIINGANVDWIEETIANSEQDATEQERFRVIAACRLEASKNIDKVIRGFYAADVPYSELLIIGDGSLFQYLQAMTLNYEEEERPHVRLIGMKPRTDVYRLFAKADLFVSLSAHEGMPIAVLEAMAAGCPVVLSDIPAHHEIAQNQKHVDFASLEEPGQYIQKIRSFAKMPAQERRRIGQNCRQHVGKYFPLHKMVSAYEQVYQNLVC